MGGVRIMPRFLDISFYRRPDMVTFPIVVRSPKEIERNAKKRRLLDRLVTWFGRKFR